MLFGSDFHTIPTPELLSGRVNLLGIEYPSYRLFIIGVGLGVGALLLLVIDFTLLGATLRAGVDNREMVAALGINIRMISQGASLLNLSLVVAETDLFATVSALHGEFFAELDPLVFERNEAVHA